MAARIDRLPTVQEQQAALNQEKIAMAKAQQGVMQAFGRRKEARPITEDPSGAPEYQPRSRPVDIEDQLRMSASEMAESAEMTGHGIVSIPTGFSNDDTIELPKDQLEVIDREIQKQIESLEKEKLGDKNPLPLNPLACNHCDFKAKNQRGLKIHISRMHL